MSSVTIEQFKTVVARRLQLEPTSLYGRSLRLSDVVVRSPVATNSIDMVEAVAGALAELELDERIDLPTLTLDNTIDDLVREVRTQLETV